MKPRTPEAHDKELYFSKAFIGGEYFSNVGLFEFKLVKFVL